MVHIVPQFLFAFYDCSCAFLASRRPVEGALRVRGDRGVFIQTGRRLAGRALSEGLSTYAFNASLKPERLTLMPVRN